MGKAKTRSKAKAEAKLPAKVDETMPTQPSTNAPPQEALGGPVATSTWSRDQLERISPRFNIEASTLPFGQQISFTAINGPTYVTAQTLVQQVSYALSDKIYTYSPETFDLDVSLMAWSASGNVNCNGRVSSVSAMQTRSGAGTIALGYMFSKYFDLTRRHVPQSLIGSAASLRHLRAALDQLSLLYSVANPFVAHIAAMDHAAGPTAGLVTDYVSALTTADDLGLGLVCSASAYESQHMSLFSTLLATVLPTIHVYDGLKTARDTLRVIDVLDQCGLHHTYTNVIRDMSKINKCVSPKGRLVDMLRSFNEELGTTYELFEYSGHPKSETVLVVFGTVEASLASQVAGNLAAKGQAVGVINIRVYRPFVEEAFLAALPASTRTVAVLGQVTDQIAFMDETVHSNLYADVLVALTFADFRPSQASPVLIDYKYPRSTSFTPAMFAAIISEVAFKSPERGTALRGERAIEAINKTTSDHIELLSLDQVEQFSFWDVDDSPAAFAPVAIGKALSCDSSSNIFVNTIHDNFLQGGTTRTDIRVSKKTIEAAFNIEGADVAMVNEPKLLNSIAIVDSVKIGGKLILKLPDFKEEQLDKLPLSFQQALVQRNISLFVLDSKKSVVVVDNPHLLSLLTEIVFLNVTRPDLRDMVEKIAVINSHVGINGNLPDTMTAVLKDMASHISEVLLPVELPAAWKEQRHDHKGDDALIDPTEKSVEAEAVSSNPKPMIATPQMPKNIDGNSVVGVFDNNSKQPALLNDWKSVAKALGFKEAYGTRAVLRPDLPVKTYTIKVKENRRLTPTTYDRNIFHIEFDLGTSGLKYSIGEALGIHAENDHDSVMEFIESYGLDSNDVVEVPSRENPDVMEARTVYQSLMQNIDIFGKPPKRFYEDLATFADDAEEKKELLTISSPDGAKEFKRRSEVDTVTYADILTQFKSARPSFNDIVTIVSPIKRREYSIASSQMVDPSTLALMIVVVSWVDPQGRDRFGQATRYLSRLALGSPITVSVKPSVMKLPPHPSAPLIMAGLGTGLAPFRAFVQYRAMQKASGIDIGPILLYLGSRHQRQEYLYGEEWEAYRAAGVITLLGTAFSRDQPNKIYIQDRMRETLDDIVEAYIRREGAFYLCGPTWPVPDVTEVLLEAWSVAAREGGKRLDARKEIERFKDQGRYVLEVY